MAHAQPLEGYTIGITADRRALEQGHLLERLGAMVMYGPSIVTEYLDEGGELLAATAALVERPPDVVVANTGIGMRAWIESAATSGLDGALVDTLAKATLVARGPKAASACLAAGLSVDAQSAAERLDDVAQLLERAGLVRGKRIAVQLDGSGDGEFLQHLERAGAEVIAIRVYRYRAPSDDSAARRLVEAACEGRLHAVTFTSRPAVENLFLIASSMGLGNGLVDAFQSDVLAACVGPVTADAAVAAGVRSRCAPDVGRLGLMVRAVSAALADRARNVEVGGRDVVHQGTVVRVDDASAALSARESDLLAALLERPGVVVSRPSLLATVWGAIDADPHVLDVTVARLRRRLAPLGLTVVSVPRRGYRVASQSSAGVAHNVANPV